VESNSFIDVRIVLNWGKAFPPNSSSYPPNLKMQRREKSWGAIFLPPKIFFGGKPGEKIDSWNRRRHSRGRKVPEIRAKTRVGCGRAARERFQKFTKQMGM